MKTTISISIIRWTARIIGTLMVVFTLLIGIGELLEEYSKNGSTTSSTFDTLMIITFTFWGVGLAGLIFALWKEGLGGIVSFLSFTIFIVFVAINPKPNVHFMNVLFIFLIPSVLYILCWWLTKRMKNLQPNLK
jgi:hypothetical protein